MNAINGRSVSEELFAVGRYLYWAQLRYQEYDKYSTAHDGDTKHSIAEWLGIYGYWAASLRVVVEGWKTARFTDPIIDGLLGFENYSDLLRRLRDSMFTYKANLIPADGADFSQPNDMAYWLHVLHEELVFWLRDRLDEVENAARMSSDEAKEWHEQCVELIGWFPLKLAEQELQEVKKKFDEVRAMVDASGSNTDSAKDLRATLDGYEAMARETTRRVRAHRQNNLAKFGLRPGEYIQREN
jgi:hypothetical protein